MHAAHCISKSPADEGLWENPPRLGTEEPEASPLAGSCLNTSCQNGPRVPSTEPPRRPPQRLLKALLTVISPSRSFSAFSPPPLCCPASEGGPLPEDTVTQHSTDGESKRSPEGWTRSPLVCIQKENWATQHMQEQDTEAAGHPPAQERR